MWNLLLYILCPVLHFYFTHKKYIHQNYLLFIILQQNIEFIKVEHDVGVLSEEDSIGMKTDDLYISPPFSIKMAEPEVSLVFI
jgi:hypothetical protein